MKNETTIKELDNTGPGIGAEPDERLGFGLNSISSDTYVNGERSGYDEGMCGLDKV
ncbi:MAG: hypothetical protein ABEJ72_04540 [Candidatus Aenigmatarchaeota archaeon]